MSDNNTGTRVTDEAAEYFAMLAIMEKTKITDPVEARGVARIVIAALTAALSTNPAAQAPVSDARLYEIYVEECVNHQRLPVDSQTLAWAPISATLHRAAKGDF